MTNNILADLAKAKATFQQRAILAALGVTPANSTPLENEEMPGSLNNLPPFHCSKCGRTGEQNFAWSGECLGCEDDNDPTEICGVTGAYCTGDFCDEYGCAKKAGFYDKE